MRETKEDLGNSSRHIDVKLRMATLADAPAVLAFHNAYYRSNRTVKQWFWEYQTYDAARSFFAFAQLDEKIIATCAVMPIPMVIGCRPVLSGKAENTLVLPEYRAKRVVRDLFEFTIEQCRSAGIQMIWGLSPVGKAFKRYSFSCYPDAIQILTRCGSLTLLVKLKLQGRTFWRGIGSAAKHATKHALKCLRLRLGTLSAGRRDSLAAPPEYAVRGGPVPAEDLNDLVTRLEAKHPNVMHARYTVNYLAWRLRDHPFVEAHREYEVYRHSKLTAWGVVVLSKRVAYISELLSEDDLATSSLMATMVKDFVRKAGELRFLCNRTDPMARGIVSVIGRFGFENDERTSKLWTVVARDICSDDKTAVDVRNWHITYLWTEGLYS